VKVYKKTRVFAFVFLTRRRPGGRAENWQDKLPRDRDRDTQIASE
jgi:hypothetical protein